MKQRVKNAEDAVAVEYGHEEFAQALARTSKAYAGIVAESAAAIAVGIALAVHVKVLYGIIIAVVAVFYYAYASASTLRRNLGISYRSESGALVITKYDAKQRQSAWIPSKLLWFEVARIDDGAFGGESSSELLEIHLPETIVSIGADAFVGCPSLERICFEGNDEQWSKVESKSDLSGYVIEIGERSCACGEEVTQ